MGVAAIGVCVGMARKECEKVTEITQNVPFAIQEHKINLHYSLMQQCDLVYQTNLKIIFLQVFKDICTTRQTKRNAIKIYHVKKRKRKHAS